MQILTVSQLNLYIKSIFDGDQHLKGLYLKGEISNFTDHYRTGHLYLTLKDDKSAVRAVMFAGNASRLRFRPENGMKVLVRGYVSVYQVTGQYQLYIEDMQPDGLGALALAFEQTKRKLAAEGLFDEDRKKPIPRFPRRIGVITSPTGAAVQDICRILKRRYPIGEIILCPVTVQGESAAGELTEAVKKFNRLKCADVLIIGRGGGSAEDLWAFNDEGLVRAVSASQIPVVSGVGHETDFTLCDFAADYRASTPSAAAEYVSPEEGALEEYINSLRHRMTAAVHSEMQGARRELDRLAGAKVLRSPGEQVAIRQMRLDLLYGAMQNSYRSCIDKYKRDFSTAAAKLEAMNPMKILSRGFAAVKTGDGYIHSAGQLHLGDDIHLTMADGSVECHVTGTEGIRSGKV